MKDEAAFHTSMSREKGTRERKMRQAFPRRTRHPMTACVSASREGGGVEIVLINNRAIR